MKLFDRERDATSLYQEASRLEVAEKNAEATALYDLLIASFGYSSDPADQEQVAKGYLQKSQISARSGQLQEAVRIRGELVARYADGDHTSVKRQVAMAMGNSALDFIKLGQPEQALQIIDDTVRRFARDLDDSVRASVARVLGYKGAVLAQQGLADESIAAFEETERIFGADDHPEVRLAVAHAMLNRSDTLTQIGQQQQGWRVGDEAVRRYGDLQVPELQAHIAGHLFGKFKALLHKGRNEEAELTLRELNQRFGGTNQAALRNIAAFAHDSRKVILCGRERHDAETIIAQWDEFVELYRGILHEDIQEEVFIALLLKIGTLQRMELEVAIIETADQALQIFGKFDWNDLRPFYYEILLAKGKALSHLGRREEAFWLWGQIVRDASNYSSLKVIAEEAAWLIESCTL